MSLTSKCHKSGPLPQWPPRCCCRCCCPCCRCFVGFAAHFWPTRAIAGFLLLLKRNGAKSELKPKKWSKINNNNKKESMEKSEPVKTRLSQRSLSSSSSSFFGLADESSLARIIKQLISCCLTLTLCNANWHLFICNSLPTNFHQLSHLSLSF